METAKVESVSFEDIAKEVNGVTPSVFETLSMINVADKIEKKNGLSYLSWSWAWAELQKRYPDASYTIERFGEEKRPYLYDENTGYMVFTTVTIEGQTHEMWLPVMDSNNNALKSTPYKYLVYKYEYGKKVWDKENNRYVMIEKTVQPATMFDINKAIMRCLVKNIGMFGLGLYIYSGEDLPEVVGEEPKTSGNNLKSEDVSGVMLTEFKTCQNKLAALGVDIRNENIKQWMADHTGYADQNADIQDPIKMKKLINAYKTLIAGKEKKAQEQANANTNQV